MLRTDNLTIGYGSILFKNISFVLGNNEKVGLIGLNGTGKTTLLRILIGEELPDSGKIELPKTEHIEYLPQEYTFEDEMLIGVFLESLVSDPKSEMYRVNKILNKLDLKVDIYQEVSTLSEGQKMKLYLAKLLINNPTILLLDEPTNHLDINGIHWLEKFIKNFHGICIIISHDRAFMNSVIDKVFEIDEQQLNVFEGNYDSYLKQKADLTARRHQQYILQEKHRDKLVTLIERVNTYSSGEKQSRALSAAKHRLIREVLNNEITDYKEQKVKDIKIEGHTHDSKQIVKIKNLSFKYSKDKELVSNANFSIFGKEKVWFYGSNGIGKTTIVKLIIGDLTPTDGEIKIGENLKWAYFSQDQSHLNMRDTVEDYFLKGTGISYNASFGIMEKFLFPKELRKVKIGSLSPGQRARLSFAIFSMKEYDFLILDEPTNHIDIRSKEVIEQALSEYKGSIFLVSHDRYFVQNIGVNRAITIENGEILEIQDLESKFLS